MLERAPLTAGKDDEEPAGSRWIRQEARHEKLEELAKANPKNPRDRYRWGVMLAAKEQYEPAMDN